MKNIIAAFLSSLCFVVTTGAVAQAWPTKPIRLIVPYPAGGGVDASGRLIGHALSEQLGQQVIVENRGGATGRIGTEAVARAAPDGYTLLLGSGAPNAVVPAVTPNLPYDAIKDFAPVSLVATTDYVLLVHPSLRVRTMKELLALARARPDELTYASSGYLSNTHLAAELMNQLANVKTRHIAYKGTGPAMVAVLTGESAMAFGGGPGAVPHIKADRLRAIATSGTKRRHADVPTISETIPGYAVNQWYGVIAPAGTPQQVIARLHKEIVKAIANPKIAQQFSNLDADAVTSTPQEFAAMIRSEIEKWRKVAQVAGIKAQ
ncbi:MAG TPA: tripartite tricarboxylate transporter substrate binding protein [Burkholderiales bacterium]|nr:tripartite tricarboxylate transporter substrate binding protein [Burkholderiales bacterium]